MTWIDRRIGAQFKRRPDTQADIDWRIKAREAAAAGIADREARYPELTAANASEAIRYQNERILFHEARLGL